MIELKKITKGNTSLSNRCRNDRNTTNNYVKGIHDIISQISPKSHDEKRGELRKIHYSKNLSQLYTSNAHYRCFQYYLVAKSFPYSYKIMFVSEFQQHIHIILTTFSYPRKAHLYYSPQIIAFSSNAWTRKKLQGIHPIEHPNPNCVWSAKLCDS